MAERIIEEGEFRSWSGERLSQALRAGLFAGCVAGIVELVPILIVQDLLGATPRLVFQAIASALLGAAAFAGGWGSVFLGLFLHFSVSLVAASLFALASLDWRFLRTRPVISGLGYGGLVFFVMSYVVVPLTRATFPPATEIKQIAMSMSVQMIAFGLPIALVVRRRLRGLP